MPISVVIMRDYLSPERFRITFLELGQSFLIGESEIVDFVSPEQVPDFLSMRSLEIRQVRLSLELL